MKVKLHEGYVGKTREGERVVMRKDPNPECFYKFIGSNGIYYGECGLTYSDDLESRFDIVGPWTEPDTQESAEIYAKKMPHGWVTVDSEVPGSALFREV